jgi:hypothetical protein
MVGVVAGLERNPLVLLAGRVREDAGAVYPRLQEVVITLVALAYDVKSAGEIDVVEHKSAQRGNRIEVEIRNLNRVAAMLPSFVLNNLAADGVEALKKIRVRPVILLVYQRLLAEIGLDSDVINSRGRSRLVEQKTKLRQHPEARVMFDGAGIADKAMSRTLQCDDVAAKGLMVLAAQAAGLVNAAVVARNAKRDGCHEF